MKWSRLALGQPCRSALMCSYQHSFTFFLTFSTISQRFFDLRMLLKGHGEPLIIDLAQCSQGTAACAIFLCLTLFPDQISKHYTSMSVWHSNM